MTHEHLTRPALFDSADYASARRTNGRYSVYRALDLMNITLTQVRKLAYMGKLKVNHMDSRKGLTVGELAYLATTLDLLKQKDEIPPKIVPPKKG